MFYVFVVPMLLLFLWALGTAIWEDYIMKWVFPEKYAAKKEANKLEDDEKEDEDEDEDEDIDDCFYVSDEEEPETYFSRKEKNDKKEDVERAYREGMNDGMWDDSFRYDSNNMGRTERERQAYEQGFLDHADEEDY